MLTNTTVVPSNMNGEKKETFGVCLSSDSKPTNVRNGSILLEMDTSTLYFFDEANSTWRAW